MHKTRNQAVKHATAMVKLLGPAWSTRVYKSSFCGQGKGLVWHAQARFEGEGYCAYVTRPASRQFECTLHVYGLMRGSVVKIRGSTPKRAFEQAFNKAAAEFRAAQNAIELLRELL